MKHQWVVLITLMVDPPPEEDGGEPDEETTAYGPFETAGEAENWRMEQGFSIREDFCYHETVPFLGLPPKGWDHV